MEDWVTIRNLKKKDPNLGTRTIALMLGISRNTVKKSLTSDDLPLYNRGEKKINEHVVHQIKSFKDGGQIFYDDVIATAILDRLLHHSHPFLINGPSYRMKDLLPKSKKKQNLENKNNEI
ncbi:ATP-binding protein [Aliarcobacter butzleri]